MAEQAVGQLLGRIEQLKVKGGDGQGPEDQSEVFRLWGTINWILQLEGRRILEEVEGVRFAWALEQLEDPMLAETIRNGLEEVKEQLKLADIQATPKDIKISSYLSQEFPQYLELPGPVIRQKIVSYLNSSDMVNVARVMPSEMQYLPRPLPCLQMEAVLPILMAHGKLSPADIQKLCKVDAHIEAMIIKRFENVEWKTLMYLMKAENTESTSLKTLAEDQGQEKIVVPVTIERLPENNEVKVNYNKTAMANLRICGNRILHAILEVGTFQGFLPFLTLSLERMPNLRALNVRASIFDLPIYPEVLPELKYLQAMLIDGDTSVQATLLLKYGRQLDFLSITMRGEPYPGEFRIGQGASLTHLHLLASMIEPLTPRSTLTYLGMFVYCPLKVVEVWLTNVCLRELLTFLGTYWTHSLESLKILLMRVDRRRTVDGDFHNQNSAWMVNLQFPKLKRFAMQDYPLDRNWAFLLLFPALEKLEYYNDKEDVTPQENPEEDGCHQLNIYLYNNKSRMLNSSVWKLFPKLGKINFLEEKKAVSLTRQQCVRAQEKERKLKEALALSQRNLFQKARDMCRIF